MCALARGVTALLFCLCIAAQPASAKILHRWSFDKDAADSVGQASAKLMDGATIRDGKLVLDGEKNWVDLPIGGTIEKLTSATFEAWFIWGEEQARWVRIFDCGRDQNVNLFFTVRSGRPEPNMILDTPRFAITNAGWQEEDKLCAPNPIEAGELVHMAITIDAENQVGKLYIDGLEVNKTKMVRKPSDLGNTPHNYLGKSQYSGVEPFLDPFFKGSITEFRIYDRALSKEEIEQNNKAGPDKLLPDRAATGRPAAENSSPAAKTVEKAAASEAKAQK
jgi:hypothetical protein